MATAGARGPRMATFALGARLLKELPREQILSMADQAVVSGGTFLATVAVARWGSPYQLGAYSIGMSALFPLLGVQEALIMLPYTIRRNGPGGDAIGLARHSLTQSALLAGIAPACLAILALVLWVTRPDEQHSTLVGALAWLAPFLLLREFARQFCFSHLRVAQALAMDCAAFVLQMSALMWLGLSGVLNAADAFLISGVAFAIASLSWLYPNRRIFQVQGQPLRDAIQENWRLGRWLLAAQIGLSVQVFVASWMLAFMSGNAAAGIYAACIALASVATPVIMGFANVLMPRTAIVLRTEGAAGMRRRVAHDAILLGTVMWGFWCVLVFASDDVTRLLYRGPAYTGQGHTVAVLALGLLLSTIGIPASNALASLQKPRPIFFATLAAALANVAVGLWLIPLLGVVGAAYGFLAGSVVGAIGRWAAFLLTKPFAELAAEPATQVNEVIRQTRDSIRDEAWTTRKVGEGAQAVVFAACPIGDVTGEDARTLVVKLYRKSIPRDLVVQQFQALGRSHSALDGCSIAGWNIASPAPVCLCESPLALVMTMARGRSLLQHLEKGATAATVLDMESAAHAIAEGMIKYWSQNQPYGDLNLDNILCDFESRTLTFLDAGIPTQFLRGDDIPAHWHPSSHDLAYLLYETATTVRRSIGRLLAETRKWTFTTEIVRTVLQAIPSTSEKERLLNEIQTCAGVYLMTLDVSWTPRGIWCGVLRSIARRRIEGLLDAMQAELRHAGAAD